MTVTESAIRQAISVVELERAGILGQAAKIDEVLENLREVLRRACLPPGSPSSLEAPAQRGSIIDRALVVIEAGMPTGVTTAEVAHAIGEPQGKVAAALGRSAKAKKPRVIAVEVDGRVVGWRTRDGGGVGEVP